MMYEDSLLGDWGDLFAPGPVDDHNELKVKDTDHNDNQASLFLADDVFQNDLMEQYGWMDAWTDLMSASEREQKPAEKEVSLSPQADELLRELFSRPPEVVDEQSVPLVDVLSLATSPSCVSCDDSTDFALGPPLSPDDIESVLSGPSSPDSLCESVTDDPEWLPVKLSAKEDPDWLPQKLVTVVSKSTTSRQIRPKPYDKPQAKKSTVPTGKKERKREQNKNAAIRYRMKKRVEADEILSEEQVLTMKNNKLNDKVDSVTREISYLKDLLREVYKAKGLVFSLK